MSTKRLTIFDTTLRDGEQAPGFSLRIDEKLTTGPPARGARRGHHRGRVPDRLGGRRRGGPARGARTSAGRSSPAWPAVRRPTSTRRRGRSSRRARRRIHIFIATSDLHLERKLRMTREACLDAAVAAVASRAPLHRRRRSSRRRTRRAATWTSCAGSSKRSSTAGAHDSQPAGHGRLLDAGRNRRRSSARSSSRVPNADHAIVQRPLPRRPRPGGGQHPGGGLGRRDGRSSARSTASASAPATRRSKRS